MAKFEKGRSGNPGGRPRLVAGRNKLRDGIARDLPDIIAAMTAAAKGGDVQAAKLLLDRTLPALRPVDRPVALPKAEGLADAATALLGALSAGQLTPDEGAKVAAVLGALAKIRETGELEQRIDQIEILLVDSKSEQQNDQHPATP